MQRSSSPPGAPQVPGRLRSESVVPGSCHTRISDQCHQEARQCLCLTSLGGGEKGQDYPEDCMSLSSVPWLVSVPALPLASLSFSVSYFLVPLDRGADKQLSTKEGWVPFFYPSPFPAHPPTCLQFFLLLPFLHISMLKQCICFI